MVFTGQRRSWGDGSREVVTSLFLEGSCTIFSREICDLDQERGSRRGDEWTQFKKFIQGSWSRLGKDQRGKGQMLFIVREGGQQLQAIGWGERPRLKGWAQPLWPFQQLLHLQAWAGKAKGRH